MTCLNSYDSKHGESNTSNTQIFDISCFDDSDVLVLSDEERNSGSYDSCLFLSDEPLALDEKNNSWKILIVDDEKDIHTVTELALSDFIYQGKKLEFFSALSSFDAKRFITLNPDIAVILLDVVMETPNAGLDFVKFVREELRNSFVRIIIRTGQPGAAPEREVIEKYNIDDYRLKTELFSNRLNTLILTSIRTFESLYAVERSRIELEEKYKKTIEILNYKKEELQQNELKLQQANATKIKFLSIIAHDLKNPLQAISLASYFLEKKYLKQPNHDREAYNYIKDISFTVKQLTDLLENILLWSKTQDNAIICKQEYLDLSISADVVVNFYKITASSKNIDLTSDIPAESVVVADKNMIDTIFRNLVSNAVKFTPPGGKIKITSKEDRNFITVSVSDTGIGISEADIDKLFKIEIQYTTIGTSSERGTGIGLILCKEFVEKLGGDIWVDSKLGNGSSFKFTVPKMI